MAAPRDDSIHAAPPPRREWYECVVCYEALYDQIWTCGALSHGICGGCYAGIAAAAVGKVKCPICRRGRIRRCRDAELRGAWMFESCSYKTRGCRVKTWRGDAELSAGGVYTAPGGAAAAPMGARAKHEAECWFRDIVCAAKRCGKSFAPGDFATHMVQCHRYHAYGSLRMATLCVLRIGVNVVCESRSTPGMFVMMERKRNSLYFALVDICEGAGGGATAVWVGNRVVMAEINSMRTMCGEGPICMYKESITGRDMTVSINAHFAKFDVGDEWKVCVGPEKHTYMTISYIDAPDLYMIEGATGDRYRTAIGDASLMRRTKIGAPMPGRPSLLRLRVP